jgi:hypothetical protein
MFNTDSNKIPKQIAGLLINRWALSCLAILTFQQAIEASATFWLVKMMASVTQGEPFLTYLVIYLATLAFPYIPGCIALILLTPLLPLIATILENGTIKRSAKKNSLYLLLKDLQPFTPLLITS